MIHPEVWQWAFPRNAMRGELKGMRKVETVDQMPVMQRAIRKGDGATLFDKFTRTRAIRRSIIQAKQA